MKIKVANHLHDSRKKPVMIVFENTAERVKFINKLAKMPDLPHHQKIAEAPDGYNKKKLSNFMRIDEDEEILKKYGKRRPGDDQRNFNR